MSKHKADLPATFQEPFPDMAKRQGHVGRIRSVLVSKIALTGAHGVGKTTLARELARVLRSFHSLDVTTTPEVPRLVCDLADDPTFFRRGKNNPLKQVMLLYAHLEYEIEAASGGAKLVVCDRTVLDHWAYSVHLFAEAYDDAGITAICEALIGRHCRTYDRIYRLPIEFPPLDDGTREGDEGFQRQIDHTLVDFLNRYAIPYQTISGTVDERCAAILNDLVVAMAAESNGES